MAAYGAELPKGVGLDQPQGRAQYGANLPKGVVLDTPLQEEPEGYTMEEPPELTVRTIEQAPRKLDILDRKKIKDLLASGGFSGKQMLAAQELDRRGLLEPEPWADVSVAAVKSIPSSAVKFGEDIAEAVTHPVKTISSLSQLGVGLIEKLMPGEQPAEKYVDAFVDGLKTQYGSIEGFKKKVSEDPVGVMGDIASVLVPAGKLATISGTTKAVKTGKTLAKLGATIEPTQVAAKVAGKVLGKIIPEDVPGKLYTSAAKFSTTLSEAKRAKLVNTALDNQIMPTVEGLERIQGKIKRFDDKIGTLIDEATKSGKKFPVSTLFRDLKELRRGLSSDPMLRKKQVDNVAKKLNLHFKKIGQKEITPAEAQQLKKAIYKETENFYEKTKKSPATIEAKQAIAKASKESLEEIIPEIKTLNKNEGALIELNKALEKSASRISNRDLIGIGVPLKGLAGGVVGGGKGAAAFIALALLDTPQVKAKLAIVANQLKKKGTNIKKDSVLYKILSDETTAEALRQSGKASKLKEEVDNE